MAKYTPQARVILQALYREHSVARYNYVNGQLTDASTCEPTVERLAELIGTIVHPPDLRDFWTRLPADEQMRLSVKYGEPPEPLTDEEKQEMSDCGC